MSIHCCQVQLTPNVARAAGTDKLEVPINEKNVLLREVSNFCAVPVFPVFVQLFVYCMKVPAHTITCLYPATTLLNFSRSVSFATRNKPTLLSSTLVSTPNS